MKVVAACAVRLVVLWVERREETALLVRGVTIELVGTMLAFQALACCDIFPCCRRGRQSGVGLGGRGMNKGRSGKQNREWVERYRI